MNFVENGFGHRSRVIKKKIRRNTRVAGGN
jgi:hypothetical protein